MNITTNQVDGETVIGLGGRFTFAAHPAFRDLLSAHVETMNGGGRVTFDLSAIEFVDSAALGMLLLAREVATRRAATIRIRGAKGQVRRMLEVSRFDTLFTVEY